MTPASSQVRFVSSFTAASRSRSTRSLRSSQASLDADSAVISLEALTMRRWRTVQKAFALQS